MRRKFYKSVLSPAMTYGSRRYRENNKKKEIQMKITEMRIVR